MTNDEGVGDRRRFVNGVLMSCWMRMVVVGVFGVGGFGFGQTRNGPAAVRIGEVGERKAKVEDGESKIEIPASDKPGDALPGEVTIVQMRTMFLELEHPDGK